VGGGIVADSEGAAEYDEAMLKMAFLANPPPRPGLIETLLWERGRGYWLLDRHMARLADSAGFFGLPLVPGAAERMLMDAEAGFAAERMRVRLLLDPDRGLSVTAVPLPAPGGIFRFVIAPERQRSDNRVLVHKTTLREGLDGPRQRAAARLGVDEVVFRNERGELTEGSITSLFIEKDGVLFTPPLSAGLLAGTLRAELLAQGRAREKPLFPADLDSADRVFLGNSVRGLMRAERVPEAGPVEPGAPIPSAPKMA
jgi:para-aminobenzoate synthetase/4-amino-4-deoxychorismate lyase